MAEKRVFCWDASVFVTLLTRETRSEPELAGLREVLHLVAAHQAVVVTSSTARTEVLGDGRDPRVRAAFNELFARPGFVSYQVSDALADLAGDLREEARRLKKKLSTPDSQYIATAMIYEAEALHTFDPHMLRLNGEACVRGLRICHPKGNQMELGLDSSG